MALNDKQEKFAQAYVLYRNATEAAKAAGYAGRSAYNQGSRLLKIGEVNERIEKQYTYATNNNHTNSALKALELLSRLRAPTDEDTPTTVEELEEDIVKSLELLGEDRTIKLFTKCSWFDEQEEEMEELQEEVEELEEILDELAEGEIIDDQV